MPARIDVDIQERRPGADGVEHITASLIRHRAGQHVTIELGMPPAASEDVYDQILVREALGLLHMSCNSYTTIEGLFKESGDEPPAPDTIRIIRATGEAVNNMLQPDLLVQYDINHLHDHEELREWTAWLLDIGEDELWPYL